MILHSHYSVAVLANTYLIVPPDRKQCILVDPTVLDVQLLDLIERNSYYVRHLLFTHPSKTRDHGIRTVRKVYDVEMYVPYGGSPAHPAHYVTSESELSLGGYGVRVLPAYDEDNQGVLFEIEGYIFSGIWLGAGVVATDSPQQTRIAFKHRVVDSLAAYPNHTPIFPYQGPPTTLGIERCCSPAFMEYSAAEAE